MGGEQARTSRIRVFDYTDYRKYLMDYYREQKVSSRAFSYRFFARKAGINSVGLYKDVVEGRQGLGQVLVVKFSQALGHGEREAEYFHHMVLFGEASSPAERRLYFRKMMSSYDSKAARIGGDQYEFYSRWYYSAARALLSYHAFRGDYAALGRALEPAIRPSQARAAIRVLAKLGLIGKDADGFYRPVDPVITAGAASDRNVQAMNIIHFQRTMLKMASKAYDRRDFRDVDMSTLTLSFSRETYLAVKKEIAELRRRIAGLAEKDARPDRVYQLSYNLFPLSRIDGA